MCGVKVAIVYGDIQIKLIKWFTNTMYVRIITNLLTERYRVTVANISRSSTHTKKVKFSHTRHRALGPELIPVYRQSACR